MSIDRHCEERSDEAIQLSFLRRSWIASRSLSSGAHSRDPLARNDVDRAPTPPGANLARHPVGAGVALAVEVFPIIAETLYGARRSHVVLTGLSINIKGLAVARGLWRAV
jgi:hypothetical protein